MANATGRVSMTTTKFADEKTHRDLVGGTTQTFYPGAMLGIDSNGYTTKFDDTAALKFAGTMGESLQKEVLSSDSSGDKKVACQRSRYASFTISSAAITDVGRPVFALYDNEVTYKPGTYKNFVGHVHRRISATEVEVELARAEGPNLVPVTVQYSAPADMVLFTADRAYKVIDIRGRVTAGASGATAVVRKAPSGTAIASGTALHSSTFDLNGTANANQTLTLSTTDTDLDLAAGDSIVLDVSGTTTGATGAITVLLIPVGR
jgi:hypothetical protein